MNRSRRFFEITPWNFQEIIIKVFQRDCTVRILIFGLKPFLYLFWAKKCKKLDFIDFLAQNMNKNGFRPNIKILSVQSLWNTSLMISWKFQRVISKNLWLLFIWLLEIAIFQLFEKMALKFKNRFWLKFSTRKPISYGSKLFTQVSWMGYYGKLAKHGGF